MIQAFWAVAAFFSMAMAWADGFPKRDYKIDTSVNPCENFYDYVCNKTIQSFELPKTRSHHSFSFDDMKENLLVYKKNYFKKLQSTKAGSSKEQQLQSYYLACMDEKAGAESERKYVAATLRQIEIIQTREQFIDLVNANLKSGKPGFLSFWANLPNFKNSERMDGYFEADVLTLPEKSYYEKAEVTEGLRLVMQKLFEGLGVDAPEQKAAWVIAFEQGLAKVYPSAVEINKRIFSLTEHSKALTAKSKAIRFGEFIGQLPVHSHVRNIYGDKTFESIDRSLRQLPLEQLKAVYLYHVLRHQMDDAYPEYRRSLTDFKAKHFGSPSQHPDRQERCTTEIEKNFGMELDAILMPKLFPNFPKEKLTAMVEKIRTNLVRSVEKNTWLSQRARAAAVLKLKTLNIRLVSPETDQEWNFNKEGVYSTKEIVENRLLYRQLQHQKSIEDLEKKFTDPVWGFGPLTINAALLPPYNAIIFPVGILQPPFYDPEAPEEVNMAGIGSVIGHELGHAIDDKGYTFDHKGRVNPWIKKSDEKKFFARTKPLVDQFNKIGHNGQFTLGENIGDLVGLTNSYETAFPAGSAKPLQLKKDFFVQYGRLWCEVQKPEIAELRKKVDPHAFGYARTNEQVKHQPGFAEAFQCKPTDPLVLPKDQILRVW